MGEVYRAHDTRLGRDVALKIVPELFAADRDRLARFTREAQTLAALNHPNIAHIHGLEESGGVRALIMELVEGEDLAQRLVRGPITVDEALPIAKQIAGALEAAHEKTIIHRDLKPANIKVREDGTVKVLDFGLAKALEAAPYTHDASQSPTITSPAMTRVGVILGTAAYMSPEQARGKPAEKASDIWAFGCVLYEMLTGTRAFEGEDIPETIANVLTHEPCWDRVPSRTPAAILVLLRRCLRKEKKRRLQDAAGVRIEIEDALSAAIGTESEQSQNGGMPRWRRLLLTGAALVGGALLVGVVAWQLKSSPTGAPQVVTRLPIPVPADEQLPVKFPGIAVSPDGTHLVYVARRGGLQQLHLRALDRLESKPMAGTEGASSPFFSPDGQWVGFFAQGKLKKIPITGGVAQILCDAGDPLGGSWAPNDIVYFAPGSFSGVWQVSATGGIPQPFTKLDPTKGEIGHRWPRVLPGGQAVLFTSRTGPGTDEWQIQVQRVSTGERRTLGQGESAHYVPTGHLVYIQTATGSLVATPFDLSRLEVSATSPVVVVDGVLSGGEGAHYTLSDNGMLVYVAGRADFDDRTLVWVDRSGKSTPLQAPVRGYETPRESPLGHPTRIHDSGTKVQCLGLQRYQRRRCQAHIGRQ
jgi:serine/threonine protein kinase